MAVKLRLMRMGRKGQPFYRIVAVDSRKRRDGAYIDKIGHYNPLKNPSDLVVDDHKALKWLNRGAIPTDTVRNLLSRRGIMMAFALQKKGVQEEELWDQVSRFRLEKEEKLKAIAAEELAAKSKTEAPEAKVEAEAAEESAVEEKEETPAKEEAAEAETESVEETAVEAEKEPEKEATEPADKKVEAEVEESPADAEVAEVSAEESVAEEEQEKEIAEEKKAKKSQDSTPEIPKPEGEA